jgi:hypothetical protein
MRNQLVNPTAKVSHAGQQSRTIAREFLGDRERGQGFVRSFGNIWKFAFELKNIICHIFCPKTKRQLSAPGKEAAGTRAQTRFEDLN